MRPRPPAGSDSEFRGRATSPRPSSDAALQAFPTSGPDPPPLPTWALNAGCCGGGRLSPAHPCTTAPSRVGRADVCSPPCDGSGHVPRVPKARRPLLQGHAFALAGPEPPGGLQPPGPLSPTPYRGQGPVQPRRCVSLRTSHPLQHRLHGPVKRWPGLRARSPGTRGRGPWSRPLRMLLLFVCIRGS